MTSELIKAALDQANEAFLEALNKYVGFDEIDVSDGNIWVQEELVLSVDDYQITTRCGDGKDDIWSYMWEDVSIEDKIEIIRYLEKRG